MLNIKISDFICCSNSSRTEIMMGIGLMVGVGGQTGRRHHKTHTMTFFFPLFVITSTAIFFSSFFFRVMLNNCKYLTPLLSIKLTQTALFRVTNSSILGANGKRVIIRRQSEQIEVDMQFFSHLRVKSEPRVEDCRDCWLPLDLVGVIIDDELALRRKNKKCLQNAL